MRYWFTSDTHFNHKGIIALANRPFKDVNHMNETMIRNWNERVKDDDIVIHLGDFCFKEKEGVNAKTFKDRLNGQMILIRGNHDLNNQSNSIIENMEIEYGNHRWFLSHRPNDEWRTHTLHGHVHTLWKIMVEEGRILVNCSVDVWDFRPINIMEIETEAYKAILQKEKEEKEKKK